MSRFTLTGLEGSYSPEKDKYGRSCHYLRNGSYRVQGVVVKIPFVKIGTPGAYLCNDWNRNGEAAVGRGFRTLKEAKLALEVMVAEDLATV